MSTQTSMAIEKKHCIRKFKQEPKYTHHRSEGMTHRRNAGSYLQCSETFVARGEAALHNQQKENRT